MTARSANWWWTQLFHCRRRPPSHLLWCQAQRCLRGSWLSWQILLQKEFSQCLAADTEPDMIPPSVFRVGWVGEPTAMVVIGWVEKGENEWKEILSEEVGKNRLSVGSCHLRNECFSSLIYRNLVLKKFRTSQAKELSVFNVDTEIEAEAVIVKIARGVISHSFSGKQHFNFNHDKTFAYRWIGTCTGKKEKKNVKKRKSKWLLFLPTTLTFFVSKNKNAILTTKLIFPFFHFFITFLLVFFYL